jgi:KDO2-lipid IV(A) lauroyltransferase
VATLGRALGWLVGSVLRIRRNHVIAAMKDAGLEASRARVNSVYAQLGTGVFELLWAAGHEPARSASLVRVDGWERVEGALAKGRGLVVATAHTGNWDLAACAMAQRLSLTVVTKHLAWRSLDRYWQSLRAVRGVDLVDASGALKEARDRLIKGGAVVFLVDQAPLRTSGIERFPFLGKMADHDATFAIVAARYRAPVVLALPVRHADGTHAVRVELVVDPPQRETKAWVRSTVEAVAKGLEGFVRERPEQWLWLHRRWRRIGGSGSRPS